MVPPLSKLSPQGPFDGDRKYFQASNQSLDLSNINESSVQHSEVIGRKEGSGTFKKKPLNIDVPSDFRGSEIISPISSNKGDSIPMNPSKNWYVV